MSKWRYLLILGLTGFIVALSFSQSFVLPVQAQSLPCPTIGSFVTVRTFAPFFRNATDAPNSPLGRYDTDLGGAWRVIACNENAGRVQVDILVLGAPMQQLWTGISYTTAASKQEQQLLGRVNVCLPSGTPIDVRQFAPLFSQPGDQNSVSETTALTSQGLAKACSLDLGRVLVDFGNGNIFWTGWGYVSVPTAGNPGLPTVVPTTMPSTTNEHFANVMGRIAVTFSTDINLTRYLGSLQGFYLNDVGFNGMFAEKLLMFDSEIICVVPVGSTASNSSWALQPGYAWCISKGLNTISLTKDGLYLMEISPNGELLFNTTAATISH